MWEYPFLFKCYHTWPCFILLLLWTVYACVIYNPYNPSHFFHTLKRTILKIPVYKNLSLVTGLNFNRTIMQFSKVGNHRLINQLPTLRSNFLSQLLQNIARGKNFRHNALLVSLYWYITISLYHIIYRHYYNIIDYTDLLQSSAAFSHECLMLKNL